MKQVIVFTAFNRPNYMYEVLNHWSDVRGISDTILDFHVEPNCPEMQQTCQEAGEFAETVLHVNESHQGVQRNPFNAINCGFTHGSAPDDFVILAEDDFIVSTDILEWFAWARQEFYDDPRVLCVSATQHESHGGLDQSLFVPWFPGWVWGTWRDRWENLIAPDWTFNYEHNGWDWRLTNYWCGEKGMVCVSPALSRSQHIGECHGVHTIPGDWFRDQQSKCFVPEVPSQVYYRPDGVPGIPNPRG
jgi:hypothetical protein